MENGECDCFACRMSEYYESVAAADPPSNKHKCKPKEYIGFTERFFYCEDCNERLPENGQREKK